jgi:hypothetical protein
MSSRARAHRAGQIIARLVLVLILGLFFVEQAGAAMIAANPAMTAGMGCSPMR